MELLVVISIIALLAAMLLPTIRLVREAARSANCRNNQHQVCLLATLYCETNDGHYPGGGNEVLPSGGGSVSWADILTREVLPNEGITLSQFGGLMSCPSFRVPFGPYYKRPYSMNSNICGPLNGSPLATPTERGPYYTSYYLGIHNARIAHPSTKMLMQDGEGNSGLTGMVWPSQSWTLGTSILNEFPLANGGQCAFRHNGAMNTTFVDLHSQSDMPNKMLNDQARYDAGL
jgi:prepilin-type processing-associated H-X9-DG protein